MPLPRGPACDIWFSPLLLIGAIGGLFLICIRCLVASFPHSGQFTPPLFGDYEAQRHWMEITLSLPLKEWYKHSDMNDLLYWGLDYPPLSAYYSLFVGYILRWIEPESVALFSSRGFLSLTSKFCMRLSVILSELLFYLPFLCFFIVSYYKNASTPHKLWIFFVASLQPALLIIDHGHFQYNCVSLGLILGAFFFTTRQNLTLATVNRICYCLAVQFKIISLYFAPAFALYFILLITNAPLKKAVPKMMWLGIVACATFALCWAPFLWEGNDTALQVLKRCFPVDRGLYEDKVANVWCSVSPLFKLKQWPNSTAFRLCLVATLLSFTPSLGLLWRKPSHYHFLLCSTIVSLSYFLFSFHVHEKTILFPMLPMTLLAGNHPKLYFHTCLVAMWSMFPLLQQEGLVMLFFAIFFLFSLFASLQLQFTFAEKMGFFISLGGLTLLGFAILLLPSPQLFPDLYRLLLTSYSCFHFCILHIYLHTLLASK